MLDCILSIYVLYEFKCNGIAAQSRAKSSCVSDQNMSTAGTGIKRALCILINVYICASAKLTLHKSI